MNMVYGQPYKEMIMGEFKGAAANGDLTVALSNDELHILINLVEQLESAAEFRKYTEGSLRTLKQKHLLYLREQLVFPVDHELPKADISITDPTQWLIAINDLRIALAVRLEIDEDGYAKYESMLDSNPQKHLFAVYYWLGAIQENLISHL